MWGRYGDLGYPKDNDNYTKPLATLKMRVDRTMHQFFDKTTLTETAE